MCGTSLMGAFYLQAEVPAIKAKIMKLLNHEFISATRLSYANKLHMSSRHCQVMRMLVAL